MNNFILLPGAQGPIDLEHFRNHGPTGNFPYRTRPFAHYWCVFGHIHRREESLYWATKGRFLGLDDGFNIPRAPAD